MSKNTTSKYMLVLQHIYAQRTFNPRQTVREFKISNNFLTAGKEIGLFVSVLYDVADFQQKAQYEATQFELVKMFNRSTSAAILYSTC
jgi:hypothetical protein